MVPNQSPQSRKAPKWRILAQVSENIYILCSTSDGYVRYAPMYIHSFRLIAPRKLLEAQLFNQQYQNYSYAFTLVFNLKQEKSKEKYAYKNNQQLDCDRIHRHAHKLYRRYKLSKLQNHIGEEYYKLAEGDNATDKQQQYSAVNKELNNEREYERRKNRYHREGVKS